MKLLGLIYMAAGLTLALLVLRSTHGQWGDIGLMLLFTAIPNALTAIFAYAMFRKSNSAGAHKLLMVACYIIGIVAGAYFYYT